MEVEVLRFAKNPKTSEPFGALLNSLKGKAHVEVVKGQWQLYEGQRAVCLMDVTALFNMADFLTHTLMQTRHLYL